MSLALQGPVCGRKEIDLRQLLDTNSNESKGGGITVEKMREAQEKLSKVLKPEQTQRAMIILRGLRAEATQKEKQEAVVSFENISNFIMIIYFVFLFISFAAGFDFIGKSSITHCLCG